MNPADKAQIAAAEFNATMARQDASNYAGAARQQADIFTNKAEQQLAQGVAILGKTGNLGTTLSAAPTSGVALGATETAEVTKARAQVDSYTKQITSLKDQLASLPQTIEREKLDENGNATGEMEQVANPEIDKIKTQIAAAEKSLAPFTEQIAGLQSLTQVKEIQSPKEMLYASGSDLLTMITTRDAMERDKRTMLRSAQQDVMAMLKSAQQGDKNTQYAKEAATWNTWSTVLGGGLRVAELGMKWWGT